MEWCRQKSLGSETDGCNGDKIKHGTRGGCIECDKAILAEDSEPESVDVSVKAFQARRSFFGWKKFSFCV